MASTSSLPPHLFNEYGSLPPECRPVDDFLYQFSATFRTCVPTYLAFVSTVLGTCSIVSWLFAQLPQIYKNYKIQSTAGLSVYFLVEWCLGDTTNLVGALLTGQATWQVIIAAYYTFVDVVLVGQYVWYERLGHGRRARRLLASKPVGGSPGGGPSEADPLLANGNGGSTDASGNGSAALSQTKPGQTQNQQFSNFHFPAIGGSPREKANGEQGSNGRPIVRKVKTSVSPTPSPHTILLVACLCIALGQASPIASPRPTIVASLPVSASSTSSDTSELAGRIISWLSTALYLLSRLPQLFKNYRRKSTAGLSPTLFAAAFCGNLFYSSSLLTNPLAWADYPAYGHNGWAGPEGSSRAAWVLSAAPFFLGAFGVLGLDAAVGIQFVIYGDGRKGKYTPHIPIVVETPPTRGNSDAPDAASTSNTSEDAPRTRVLAVPRGRRPGPGGAAPEEFDARSWRRVSGWMRGWVPSFSPDSWNRQGYMDAAAAAGRKSRGILSGAVTPDGEQDRSRSISRIRAEADDWERRNGGGSIGAPDDEIEPDEDRPLLERDDIPGSAGQYGSL